MRGEGAGGWADVARPGPPCAMVQAVRWRTRGRVAAMYNLLQWGTGCRSGHGQGWARVAGVRIEATDINKRCRGPGCARTAGHAGLGALPGLPHPILPLLPSTLPPRHPPGAYAHTHTPAERTVALLAFEDTKASPVGDLMDVAQRQKTASELNAAILAAQAQEREPRLPLLLKLLLWAQAQLDERAVYPRIADLASAQLVPPPKAD